MPPMKEGSPPHWSITRRLRTSRHRDQTRWLHSPTILRGRGSKNGANFPVVGRSDRIVDAAGCGGRRNELQRGLMPWLNKNCVTCHNSKKSSGGVDFSGFKDQAAAKARFDVWKKAVEQVRTGNMPPDEPLDAKSKQPLLGWYDATFDTSKNPDPGPPLMRQLTRNEYSQTMRDLFRFYFDPAGEAGIPHENVVTGFPNRANGLVLESSLMEALLHRGRPRPRPTLHRPRHEGAAHGTPGRHAVGESLGGGSEPTSLTRLRTPRVSPRGERQGSRAIRGHRRPGHQGGRIVRDSHPQGDEADPGFSLFPVAHRGGARETTGKSSPSSGRG